MRGRLRVWWQAASGSLWFVPTGMIVGAILLAVAMVELSDRVDREALVRYPRVFGAGAQSSREMLATIAGAMMTVAGVTFSITVVAVTQASSQYTPRILRNFMRDRPSQVALGTLCGVFVYCIVVLRTVRGDDELRFIPALAVLGAMSLAIVGIGVLVYYIHHVAGSLQASGLLARVRDDTLAAVDRLFPDGVGDEAPPPEGAGVEAIAAAHWRPILSRRTGYLTHVDGAALVTLAERYDVVLRMEHGIGDHVVAGTPLVSAAGRPLDDDAAREVAGPFAIADYRTVEQDAGFGIRQMVDVAVKALSPGVNDTTTAVASVDALGAVLVRLANRRVETRFRTHDGRLRVVARGPTFERLVKSAVDEIRQNAGSNVSVLARLLATLALVLGETSDAARRDVLVAHAARILAVAERTVPDPDDRAEVRRAHAAVLAAARRPPTRDD